MAQVSIFVSYSHEDNEWCRPFVDALKAVGYDVWYDETGIAAGAAWVATIQRELQARDVFLLVLTPDAWASKWVQDEVHLAFATRRRIIPLLLRNTQVDGFLLTVQWVTAIDKEPQVAARSVIVAVESGPAPGREVALQAPTETLDELITLCRALITEERFTEALAVCSRSLALDSKSIDVLRLKGWVLKRINEPQKAVETWAQALSLAKGERVASLAQDVVGWLLGVTLVNGIYGYNLESAKYLPLLVSQVTNSDALYEVIESLLKSPATPMSDASLLHEFVSAVRDDSVLGRIVATHQGQIPESLQKIENRLQQIEREIQFLERSGGKV